jgi:hypothetical protein
VNSRINALRKAPFGALFLFAEHSCQFRQTLPVRILKFPGNRLHEMRMFGPKTLICLEQANGTKPAVLVVTAL